MRACKLTFVLLLISVSSCFGQYGEKDRSISGIGFDVLHQTVKFYPMIEPTLVVKGLLDEKERGWLEKNWVKRTSLFYYSYQTNEILTNGYCLVKDGIVSSTFLLDKEKPLAIVPYHVPSNLLVDIHAESKQPVEYPAMISLTVRGKDHTPFSYRLTGPGEYPNAGMFRVTITDEKSKSEEHELTNGQYTVGSGHEVEVKADESVEVPASLGLLPAGVYSIKISDGRPIPLEVTADAKLSEERQQQLVADIRKQNPFFEYVANHYKLRQVLDAFPVDEILAGVRNGDRFFSQVSFENKLQPVMDALQSDLSNNDTNIAARVAMTILLYGNPPNTFTGSITKAMRQLLNSSSKDSAKSQLEGTLAWLASEIGSEDAMIPILDLLHSKTSGLNEESRSDVVTCLAEFKQGGATEELRHLLNDPELTVRTTAALALAQRKEPDGLAILVADGLKLNPFKCSNLYDVLLNFPEDPRVEPAINRGLDDEDLSIRHQAQNALKALQTIRILKDHGAGL